MSSLHTYSSHPPSLYKRHQPEQTLLYQLIQENLLTFYEQMDKLYEKGLPDFVKKEFDEFLRCGILPHGFLRVRCESCHDEKLVAFSCKRRGFCPSCGAKKMVESAAHLVDAVFPRQPLRQWVLSFPFQLRFLLAKDPKVMSGVLGVIHRVISTYLVKKAGLTKKSGAKTGAVTFIQRFGGSLNLNIHFHIMYLDGVYAVDKGKVQFRSTPTPSQSELDQLVTTIAHRITQILEKRGLIIKDEVGQGFLASEPMGAMDEIQASSLTYRITLGRNKGQKALTLHQLPTTLSRGSELLANHSGFSLHAGVACRGDERKKLERICRYISRPSVSEERLSLNDKGQVVYKLKKTYDNGTTHIVLEPLDFLSRLAALVPKPRVNLIRFNGVFAPHCQYREQIVPQTSKAPLDSEKKETKNHKTGSMTWAQRLKRVFAIDIETCLLCGGKIKVLSSIEDPPIIKQILTHIGWETETPQPWPPRGPPQIKDEWETI